MSPLNAPASGVAYFTPAQAIPAGTAIVPQPDGKPIPKLFQPIKIRGVEFQNRIFLSPLCQYSADDGHPTPWHMAHLGGILTRGPGLTFVEASAVLPEGRITPEDAGIWSDDHIASFVPIVDFAHSQGQKIAIQIAHAGRKASSLAPWIKLTTTASKDNNGWPDNIWGPSPIPHSDTLPVPKELTKEGIQVVVRAFADAAKRAVKAGFDVVEIHNSHGYLLYSFLSPMSNKRTDEYGGSFENRTRLTLEVVDAVRAAIPEDMPLFLRISATEGLETTLPDEDSWRSEDTVKFARILATRGVDLIDVSAGGNHPKQAPVGRPGQAYHANLSEDIKRALGSDILVSVVGGIINGHIAQEVLDKDQADVVFVGRQFQRNPGTVWAMAEDLNVSVHLANQIRWGFLRDLKKS